MNFIDEILKSFDFDGELISVTPFGSGHINSTYKAEYNDNGIRRYYVIQKINSNVFKNTDDLMNNIFSVTSYLKDKIKSYGGDVNRETINYIKTTDGALYCKTDNGEFYRAYVFVDNSKAYDSADTPELFKKSGIAFGRFQKLLADFPAQTLNEIIPNFHNTIWRYENEFLPALGNDFAKRADTCQNEIEFIKSKRADCSRLVDMLGRNELPVRVTHNDTKLNNVLFDNDTNEAICVIDLDTVMPGLALYDFGDSIRFGANTTAEDEPDTSKVKINLDYFKAYAEGFLSEAGDSLTKAEIDNLAFSAKLMTLECAMRFLTDYLNCDTYFKTEYPEHNLVRAKNQIALVKDIEANIDKMESIIKELS